MKMICCIDDNNGILFVNKRVSKDSKIIEDITKYTDTIYGSKYSKKLFPNIEFKEYKDEKGICYFHEDLKLDLNPSEIILYKFNRKYPSTTKFNIDLESYKLKAITEFKGTSHDKITKEIYIKE